MSIYSNDNIRKITKLTTRELPHLVQKRENNGLYSKLQLSLWSTSEKLKVCFCQKGENAMKLQNVTFQKSQKPFAENLHERPPIQNIQ